MNIELSVIIITKNAASVLRDCLISVQGLADEIVVVDDYSTDDTVSLANEYGARVYVHHETDLGKQKQYALQMTQGTWILSLDSDEKISGELRKEIREIIEKNKRGYKGYKIGFRNHFLGRPVVHGGENYAMLRLFKKNAVIIPEALVHERFQLKEGSPGKLNRKIYHYSYRSLWQMFNKFTDYAVREGKQKSLKGERVHWKHLVLYPIHMFWARFVEDKGYKDGLFRLPLDIGFAYMEFMTYIFLLLYSVQPKNQTS